MLGWTLNKMSRGLRPLPVIDREGKATMQLSSTCLPYFEFPVSAGHPSAVDDPFRRHLDLGSYLISHPKNTYYFKASGYSMLKAGINHNDLLVVDTALKPKHRDIVIAVLNGEVLLKRFYLEGSQIKLLSSNP